MTHQGMTPSAGAVLSAANEYNALLSQVDSLTDQLSTAIHDSQVDSINTLLASRESLFTQMSAVSNVLTQSLSQLDAPNIPAISDAMNTCKHLHEVVARKQADCESALRAQMQTCKNELNAIGNRKGLRSAYSTPKGSAPQAQFLDNRL